MMKGLLIALTLPMLPEFVQASTDPFVGRWSLDVRNSIYSTGTHPKSMTIEMKQVGNGVWYESATTFKNGAVMHTQYTAHYDGRQAMVETDHGFMLPVSLKRMGARTVEASYSRGFQIVATSRRVVSLDGKTMRITTISKDQAGRSVKTIGLYKRE